MSFDNSKWLTYGEYLLQQKYFAQRETEVLCEMGLGWLVEFSASFKNKNSI
jgi:hypothetical protein